MPNQTKSPSSSLLPTSSPSRTTTGTIATCVPPNCSSAMTMPANTLTLTTEDFTSSSITPVLLLNNQLPSSASYSASTVPSGGDDSDMDSSMTAITTISVTLNPTTETTTMAIETPSTDEYANTPMPTRHDNNDDDDDNATTNWNRRADHLHDNNNDYQQQRQHSYHCTHHGNNAGNTRESGDL